MDHFPCLALSAHAEVLEARMTGRQADLGRISRTDPRITTSKWFKPYRRMPDVSLPRDELYWWRALIVMLAEPSTSLAPAPLAEMEASTSATQSVPPPKAGCKMAPPVVLLTTRASSARKRKVCKEDGEPEERPARRKDKGKACVANTEEAEAEAAGKKVGEGVNKFMQGGHWAYIVHLGQLTTNLN